MYLDTDYLLRRAASMRALARQIDDVRAARALVQIALEYEAIAFARAREIERSLQPNPRRRQPRTQRSGPALGGCAA